MIKHEGLVPWWRYRHKNDTLGVERWCPPDVEDGEISFISHYLTLRKWSALWIARCYPQACPRRPGHRYSSERSLDLWHTVYTPSKSLDNTALQRTSST